MARMRDQEPDREVPAKWHFVRLEPGEEWRGFLAGHVRRFHCHAVGKVSKPCRKKFTGGALKCASCEEGHETFYRGYVPLYSAAGVEHVAIVGERYVSLAKSIKFAQPTKVTKLLAKGCPIRVEPDTRPVGQWPEHVERRPREIDDWLLKVWGDGIIEQWVSEHPVGRLSDSAVSLPTDTPVPHSTSMVPPVELVTAANERRKAKGEVIPQASLADFPALAARIAEGKEPPSVNGKHKPPKKG